MAIWGGVPDRSVRLRLICNLSVSVPPRSIHFFEHNGLRVTVNELTETIIGGAIEVHRALGPGLLESAYIQCLCRELQIRQVPFVLEQPLPLIYKGLRLDCGYRVDLVVADQVVVEVKVVDRIARVH